MYNNVTLEGQKVLQMTEEIECMENIMECLKASLRHISEFATSNYDSNSDSESDTNNDSSFSAHSDSESGSDMEEEVTFQEYGKHLKSSMENKEQTVNQKFQAPFIQQAIQQAHECFSLTTMLLESDMKPERLSKLLYHKDKNVVPMLISIIVIPIPKQINQENIAAMSQLQIAAIECLTRFVSICSYECQEGIVHRIDKTNAHALMRRCVEDIVDQNGLGTLLNLLEVMENEDVRVALSEFLFVLVIRNEISKLAITLRKGLPTFFQCLNKEMNSLVRLHICAIIREFCVGYLDELLQQNVIIVTCKLVNIDPSPDIRALCVEILQALFKDPDTLVYISRMGQYRQDEAFNNTMQHQNPKSHYPWDLNFQSSDDQSVDLADFSGNGTAIRDWVKPLTENGEDNILEHLCEVLVHRLQMDNDREVLESSCKLLETLFTLPIKEFIDHFINIRGWKALIRCIKFFHVRPAALATRSLRYLLQNCDHEHQLGYIIIAHYPSLSVLLKTTLEHYSGNEHKQALAQERYSGLLDLGIIDGQQGPGGNPMKHAQDTKSSHSKRKIPDKLRRTMSKPAFGSSSPRNAILQGVPSEKRRKSKRTLLTRKQNNNSGEPSSKSISIAKKLLRVELAICVSIVLAQNSQCRAHIQSELSAFPLWMSALRSAIISHLSMAEVEYFYDVHLIDATGENLARESAHALEQHVRYGLAISTIFRVQEKRIHEVLENSTGQARSSSSDSVSYGKGNTSPWSQFGETNGSQSHTGKLKSFILSYAIHLTFAPMITQPTPASNGSTPPSSSRSTLNSQRSSKSQNNETTQPEVAGKRENLLTSPRIDSPRKIQEHLQTYISPSQKLDTHSTSQSDELDHQLGTSGLSAFVVTPRKNNLDTACPEEVEIKNTNSLMPTSYPSPSRALGYVKISERSKIGLKLLCRFAQFFVDENEEREKNAQIRKLQQELSYTQDPRRLQILKDYYRIAVAASAGAPGSMETMMLRNYFNASGHGRAIASVHAGFFAQSPRRGVVPEVSNDDRTEKQYSSHATVGTRFQRTPIPAGASDLSPQKLLKSWSQIDVREQGDLFEFNLSFDVDFRLPELEKLHRRAVRHRAFVKRSLLSCPQGVNGKGRRTFLMDMIQNIMPRIIQLIEELIDLVRERGEREVRMPIYLWKGKTRPDTTINPANLVEIFEYIKMYLAGIVHNNERSLERGDNSSDDLDQGHHSGRVESNSTMRTPYLDNPDNRHMEELDQALREKLELEEFIDNNDDDRDK